MPDSALKQAALALINAVEQDWPSTASHRVRVLAAAKALRGALPAPAAGEPELPDVDDLAQEIRRVDGNHSLGAGALAEALHPFIRAYGQAMAEHARRAAMEEALQAAADVDEPGWHGYECPNTFQDGVSAAIAAIRAAAPPQGEPR